MRNSRVSGSYIYTELDKLYRDLADLINALKGVEQQMGTSSHAYKILSKERSKLKKELLALENVTYIAEVIDDVPPF